MDGCLTNSPALSAYRFLFLFTTGEQCFAVRAKGTAKGGKRTAKPLPCADARQRAHGNVLPGNEFFAVRFSRTARQRSLPCV
jgi:hypothetical protein